MKMNDSESTLCRWSMDPSPLSSPLLPLESPPSLESPTVGSCGSAGRCHRRIDGGGTTPSDEYDCGTRLRSDATGVVVVAVNRRRSAMPRRQRRTPPPGGAGIAVALSRPYVYSVLFLALSLIASRGHTGITATVSAFSLEAAMMGGGASEVQRPRSTMAPPSSRSTSISSSGRGIVTVTTCLHLAARGDGDDDGGKDDDGKKKGNSNNNNNNRGDKNRRHGDESEKGRGRRQQRKPSSGKGPGGGGGTAGKTNSTSLTSAQRRNGPRQGGKRKQRPGESMGDLVRRIKHLEAIVASQALDIGKLREECRDLGEAASAFAQVVELLRQAGLTMENYGGKKAVAAAGKGASTKASSSPPPTEEGKRGREEKGGGGGEAAGPPKKDIAGMAYDYYTDEEIFGSAPSSVIDAADAAGAAILAALLGGKKRMLVDVRDAELSRDPDMLVQFIELAVLPVAAGLEGLKESERNRVKVVFPTVSQLLQYRRTMALAGSTDVVALSTLGFDPVEERDSLVVIIAPSPDDEEGLEAMNELLQPTDPERAEITQPVVVLNHHMVPVAGPVANFSVAYHLRLLSVQYMTGDMTPEYLEYLERGKRERRKRRNKKEGVGNEEREADDELDQEDDALEAAMDHAQELGVHHGLTRAMVIRAYPRPWHVFVDTSPDTDADFEVAATFDKEPSQDEVNYAIVECLEGSEREDELVAQQMQAALESGQLNSVSEMLDETPNVEIDEGADGSQSMESKKNETNDEDEDFYNDFDFFGEDSC